VKSGGGGSSCGAAARHASKAEVETAPLSSSLPVPPLSSFPPAPPLSSSPLAPPLSSSPLTVSCGLLHGAPNGRLLCAVLGEGAARSHTVRTKGGLDGHREPSAAVGHSSTRAGRPGDASTWGKGEAWRCEPRRKAAHAVVCRRGGGAGHRLRVRRSHRHCRNVWRCG
jgi:hypothetical protein